MNTVHIDQARRRATSQSVEIKLDALLDDVRVPRAVARLTAEDELNAGIEKLDGLGPLVSLLCVVFLCHLADLPGTPHLVSEGPVLDLVMVLVMGKVKVWGMYIVRLFAAILTAEVGVVAVSVRVAVLDPSEGFAC